MYDIAARTPETPITTLVREKVLSLGPDLPYTKWCQGVRARLKESELNRAKARVEHSIMVKGEDSRELVFYLPWKPAMDHHKAIRVYFEPNSRRIQACTPAGEDIPGAEIPWRRLIHNNRMRPLLRLLHLEGLIQRIPGTHRADLCRILLTDLIEPRATTLDLPVALERGCVFAVLGPPESTVMTTLYLHLDSVKGVVPVRIRSYALTPGHRYWLVPYVDSGQRLRLWDVLGNKDILLRNRGDEVTKYSYSPSEVKKMYPKLFAWGQSLGYWKDVP